MYLIASRDERLLVKAKHREKDNNTYFSQSISLSLNSRQQMLSICISESHSVQVRTCRDSAYHAGDENMMQTLREATCTTTICRLIGAPITRSVALSRVYAGFLTM